jgi:hypothetical protein
LRRNTAIAGSSSWSRTIVRPPYPERRQEVIKRNERRRAKALDAKRRREPITLYTARDEDDEAQ